MMRFFQKTHRRAKIDISYSTGFSPHQIMSFAAPLGVGLESNGEYLDIEVNSLISTKEFIEKFNDSSVKGVEVVDVRLLPDGSKNAMASVAAAIYTVRFREGREPKEGWQDKFETFMQQQAIVVTKQTKKSVMELDLKPFIFEYKVVDNELILTVDASSAGNIKPGMVVGAFFDYLGEELLENALLITREDTLGKIVENEEEILVPLAEFGTIIE